MHRNKYGSTQVGVAQHYFAHFGPTRMAFESLDEPGRQALHIDLQQLWERHNQADDGTTRADGEMLAVVAVR